MTIKKLEAATGADRELDAEIYTLATGKCAHQNTVKVQAGVDGYCDECIDCGENDVCSWHHPSYTASVDAALTLVPEGYALTEMTLWPEALCRVTILETHKVPSQGYSHSSDERIWRGEAPTLPLAICIAALRAKGG